ncbi:Cof-type HAD-IIB family hydrolase [Acetivibrio ethanolgignens]|uniref:Haloacid dehalogenase n=1 Tax=Acetivibrio ethanolgignens TaxID=290052 RepID=A0A0V8QCX4_9FIRM|nr:Cof-type HAD-IIB family hydrolase [Acetivibrio ethanolgignens]KSV58348.1 haloacid dehalogenase [Acetivibrio ethanolgignens]
MAYELIVLDLDGTLTNSQKEISPKTKEALFRIQKEGVRVVLASGRPTPGIMPLARELCLDKHGGYILSFNGGKIINIENGRLVYNAVIPKELIPEIYEASRQYGTGIVTYTDDKIVLGSDPDPYIEKEQEINKIPYWKPENFVEAIDFPVNKFLLTGEPERMESIVEKLKEQFGEDLNIFRSEPFFIEIMPPNIDKAYSLSKLLEQLHYSRKQMICCGDGFNDISMIRYAGLGVAMANAQPEVKAVADFITLSNDEDGIACVIEKFI